MSFGFKLTYVSYAEKNYMIVCQFTDTTEIKESNALDKNKTKRMNGLFVERCRYYGRRKS